MLMDQRHRPLSCLVRKAFSRNPGLPAELALKRSPSGLAWERCVARTKLRREVHMKLGLFLPAAVVLVVLLPALMEAAGCGAIAPDALDAVAVAPQTHKVLLENDRVRVLEVSLPAG